MQLLIDLNEESIDGLLMAAEVLTVLAQARGSSEETQAAGPRRAPPVPAKAPATPAPPPIGKPVAVPAPPVPLPPGNVPPPPVNHPEVHPDALPVVEEVPAGTSVDPATAFGGASVQVPPPPAAIAPAAATTLVPPTLAPVPAPPPAPGVSNADVSVAGNSSPPTQTASSAVGEVDKNNFPWDARVHSETKKKNADGTWRYRRNLDEFVKEVVVKELTAIYGTARAVVTPATAQTLNFAASAALPSVPPPPAPVQVPPPPSTVIPQPPTASVQLPQSADVGVPNAAGSVVVPPITSFRDLMQKVNVALAQGRLTQAQLAEACKGVGVDGVTQLAVQPMLVPAVDQYIARWLSVA